MAIGFLMRGGKAARLAALDLLRTNVMLADAKLNITYMNPPLLAFMREAETELKREMPQFAVNKLVGSNIDIFHKNPQHQRALLAKLEKPHFATITIGHRQFDLQVVPLKSRAHHRLSGGMGGRKNATAQH